MTLLSSFMGKREEIAPAVTLAHLEQLLADIKGERRTLEALLSSAPTTELASVRSGVDEVEKRALTLARQLETLDTQAARLTEAVRGADDLERRFTALEQRFGEVEVKAEEAGQQTARVVDAREALEQAIAQAQEATTRLVSLHDDSEIAQLANQIPAIRDEYARIRQEHGTLLKDADTMSAKTATALQAATAAEEGSRDAAARVSGAARQIEELQRKVDDLAQLDALSHDTAGQLQALNGLAEHVATKVKALESQGQTVERALVDSRRVGEMLWEMEAQIGRLTDGSAVAGRVEENLAQLERLHKEVALKLEESARSRSEFTARADLQQREAVEVAQALQTHLDRLSVRRQEIDTLAERLRAVQAGLAEAEGRMNTVSAAESTMAILTERVQALSAQVAQMTEQAQALEQQHAGVAVLEERLDRADRSARQTIVQIDLLGQRQKDLEALKAAFDAFDQMHHDTRRLVDDLRQQKQAFAGFVQHVTEFMKQAPQIRADIDDLDTRVSETKESAERAIAMGPDVEDLTDRLANLGPRLHVVDDLQGRLSALHELSSEIDRRLGAQLARHGEIEQLRVGCDGLATQAADIQHRLAALEHTQARLAPLSQELTNYALQLSAARASLASLQRDEASIAAQERRMTDMHDAAVALATEIAGRIDTVHALQAELTSAGAIKDTLYEDLARLQALQRTASAAARETEEHIEEIAGRTRELEEHRMRFASIEHSIARVESLCSALDELANSTDAKIAALGERERIVDAVRQELDTIHAVSTQTHEDLAAIAARRAEIAEGRAELDRLALALTDTSQKIADVERRGAAVEDVRRKADAIACHLHDVRITLDTIGEQKAMIDHVSETLTRLDDVISEARGTTKALQAERKLAQRIVENVRNIHARAGAEIRQVG